MKTLKTIIPVMLMVALLASGCGKDPVSPQQPAPNPNVPQPTSCQPRAGAPASLASIWVHTAVTINGESQDLAEALDWENGTVVSGFMIEQDGYFAYIQLDGNDDLTWAEEGTVMTDGDCIKVVSETQQYAGKWSIRGDELTVTVREDGNTAQFKAVRVSDGAGSPAGVAPAFAR